MANASGGFSALFAPPELLRLLAALVAGFGGSAGYQWANPQIALNQQAVAEHVRHDEEEQREVKRQIERIKEQHKLLTEIVLKLPPDRWQRKIEESRDRIIKNENNIQLLIEILKRHEESTNKLADELKR